LRFVWLIGLFVGFGIGACDSIQVDLNERAQTLSVQREIAHYESQIGQLKHAQAAWMAAMEGLNRSVDTVSVARAMRKEVLPRLRTYAALTRLISPSSVALRQIHIILVEAVSEVQGESHRFADGLSEANYPQRRVVLQGALQVFHRRQQAYRERLGVHYANYGRVLSGGSEVPLDD